MKRRRSREIALKVLYAVDLNENPADSTFKYTLELENLSESNDIAVFASRIIETVLLKKDIIDSVIDKYLINWKLSRIAQIDKTLLRIGIVEILFFKDIPRRVTINEIVELSKKYGDKESYKFVNGVLDRIKETDIEL